VFVARKISFLYKLTPAIAEYRNNWNQCCG